jgi:hypothetical protein
MVLKFVFTAVKVNYFVEIEIHTIRGVAIKNLVIKGYWLIKRCI